MGFATRFRHQTDMSHLIVSRTGDVLGITIDRPAKRNALSRAVLMLPARLLGGGGPARGAA